MFYKKLALIALVCTVAIMITSCSSEKSGQYSDTSSAADIYESQVLQTSSGEQPNFSASIVKEAENHDSTPGRVALSMLICRLDSSHVYSDLVKKNAKDLFDILSETAFEKDITLESLNNTYGLSDILASEDIYVIIESNNVTSLPSPSTSGAASSSTTVSVKIMSSIQDGNESSEVENSIDSDGENEAPSENSSDSENSEASSQSESDTAWIEKFQNAIRQPVQN